MTRLFPTLIAIGTALILMPSMAGAINFCDSFGQDWDLSIGAFGGSYPGSFTLAGCRDCDGSLGCLVVPQVDGVATVTSGRPFSIVWSMTAYDSPSDTGCVSTHWTGASAPPGTFDISGAVSNENGPFGGFSMSLGSCRGGAGGADPAAN